MLPTKKRVKIGAVAKKRVKMGAVDCFNRVYHRWHNTKRKTLQRSVIRSYHVRDQITLHCLNNFILKLQKAKWNSTAHFTRWGGVWKVARTEGKHHLVRRKTVGSNHTGTDPARRQHQWLKEIYERCCTSRWKVVDVTPNHFLHETTSMCSVVGLPR